MLPNDRRENKRFPAMDITSSILKSNCSPRIPRPLGRLLRQLTVFALVLGSVLTAPAQVSPVRIQSWEKTGANTFRLTFQDTSVTNVGYELEWTPALRTNALWSWLSNATLTPLGGGRSQVEAAHPNPTNVFYRVFAFGADRDMDGLLTSLEMTPYTVTVTDGNGNQTMRQVTSDPRLRDTDGDGLDDFTERLLFLDPRLADTDGDLLSDAEEKNVYLSNPANVDTDGDSGGNPLLFDGSELLLFGTSPRLADTDGDNISDRDEILGNTTNPLVSEIPKPYIEISDDTVDIRLNVTYSSEQGGATNFSARLSQANTSALSKSDSVANQVSVEASLAVTVGVEATAGLPPSASVSASATASVSAGYTRQNTTTFDASSSQTAQEEYEKYQSYTFNRTEQFSDGRLSVDLKVRNEGTVTFQMSNLSVVALKRNPNNPTNLQTVATLTPSIPGIALTPGQEIGPINVSANNLNADVIKEILAQPSGLIFKVLTFDLTGDGGLNFAFLTQTNLNRTAGVTIDYGNGTVEKHRVASNVRVNPDGTAAGVIMKDVLRRYLRSNGTNGVPYTVGTNSVTGRQVLTGVGGVQTGAGGPRRFWFIAGTSQRQTNPTTDFENIVLMPGDQIYLIYARDDDNDKLLDREEMLYGSSDSLADTDGDGLNDFFEIRTGWIVDAPVPGYPRHVYPDARFVDTDGDGLSDVQEFAKLTDPRVDDTDRDGIIDSLDSDPLVRTNTLPTFGTVTATVSNALVLLSGNVTDREDNILSVVVNWGDGTVNSTVIPGAGTTNFVFNTNHVYTVGGTYSIRSTATDARGFMRTNTNSVTVQLFPRTGLVAEYLFNGNARDSSGNNFHGSVQDSNIFTKLTPDRNNAANKAFEFLSTGYVDDNYGEITLPALTNQVSYTYSTWINHEPNSGAGQRTIIGQDANRAFYIDSNNNRLRFGVPSGTTDIQDTANMVANTWTHVAATVANSGGNTTVALYRNGVLTTNRTFAGTITLTSPAARSRIGVYAPGLNNQSKDTPFLGKIDNVRVYNRTLSAAEITAVFNDPD